MIPRKIVFYLQFGALISAVVLWSYNLGSNSFWDDEILSIFHARVLTNFTSLFSLQQGNAHPPVYFLLLRYWLSLGNDSESWIRLLSVLLALPAIPCIYFLGKYLVNQWIGISASYLYVVMPLMFIYNREVRMYSLFTTLSCISLLLLLRAIEKDRAVPWILYSLVTFITLVTHYHGFLVLGAQSIFLFLHIITGKNLWRLSSRFLLSAGVSMILFLPFVPAIFDAYRTFGSMWQSGSKSVLVTIGYLSFSLALGQTIMPWNPIALIGIIAVVTICAYGLWYYRSHHKLIMVLLSYGMVVFILGPIVSHNMPRYYLFFVPLLCIWLASGIVCIKPLFISLILALLLLFSWITADINYYAGRDFHIMSTVEPWREVAEFLSKNVLPEDKIIGGSQSLRYYYLPRYSLQNQIAVDIFQDIRVAGSLPKNLWLVVSNPASTEVSLDIRNKLVHQYGYVLVDIKRFLRDQNYFNKQKFFNKNFAEYRVEIFKLSR